MKNYLLVFAFTFFTIAGFSQMIINDNFDSYTLGALGVQAPHWSTWSGTVGGTEDGIVGTEQAFSPMNSFKIEGQGGPQDVLLLLGDSTSGNYCLSWKFYVEGFHYAYFNLQKDEIPQVQFGQEVYFSFDGTGSMDGGGSNVAQFTYPQDVWFDVVQYFDLDNDHTSLFIDGKLVHSWQFSLSSQNTSTPLLQLGAIDFYARSIGQHKFFLDDVKFEKLSTNPNIMRQVKLTVDMRKEIIDGTPVSANGVHVAGSFNGWDPAATAMMDNGDSTYSAWVPMEQLTTSEYKFVNGNTWGGDEAVPMECGVDNGQGGYNRAYFVELNDTIIPAVCFGYCMNCETITNIDKLTLASEINLGPNPTQNDLYFSSELFADGQPIDIIITNQVGQTVKVINELTARQINISDLATGVYFVKFITNEAEIVKRVVKQ